MEMKHHFKDWAGDVDGYGDSLEIRVYATALDSHASLPGDMNREAAKRHLPPVMLKAQPLERDERVRALLNFAEKFQG